ncbi:MAG: VWA domain-containing protein [Acidobacteria bacterium]|nr:VWA domain-containing protein [Acidobacteriota bacterium]
MGDVFRFQRPESLWLGGLAVMAFLLWAWDYRQRRKQLLRFKRLSKVHAVSKLRAARTEWIRVALLAVGVLCLALAVAEPEAQWERKENVVERYDVVLLMDTSLSMLARDIFPLRLHRALQEMGALLSQPVPEIQKWALVSFSGTSFILSYLGGDPQNILYYLDFMEQRDKPIYGTDIGAAIGSGLTIVDKELEVLKRTGTEAQPNKKIFVMLSDGEDHGERLATDLAEARKRGIRIYTIGIGREGFFPIPLPVTFQTDGKDRFLRDEDGQLVSAGFGESTLRWVAESTGGAFWRSRSGADVARSLREILHRERKVVGQRPVMEFRPVYYYFLCLAFAALCGYLVL